MSARVPRVLVVGVKQETATFSPATATLDDFEVVHGAAASEALRGTATEVGGVLDEALDLQLELGTIAWAPSGGAVDARTWDHLRSAILADVARAEADAVLVVAHGAMVCEDADDPEGDLFAGIRALIGARPLVTTLDLHAVVTGQMLAHADVLVPFHTYPHVDHHQTGRRAVQALRRLLAGEIPATAFTPVPALVRGDELLTETGLLGRLVARCQAAEEAGALAAAVMIGNPFTDVAELRSGVLVTTAADLDGAAQLSSAVARDLWDARHRLRAQLVAVDAAVRSTLDTPGPVVLADQADATSSGAPGDAVTILRALLSIPSGRPALVTVVDAPAAEQACALGAGQRATFRLGGTIDARHEPLTIEATVVRADPQPTVVYEDRTLGRPGPSAVLEVDGIFVLVTSRAIWVVGRKVFEAFGVDPARSQVVVVKSPNGYRPHYQAIAAQMIPVDGEGATSAALERLPYVKVRRPMWPLDDGFQPALEPLRFFGRQPV